MTYFAAQPDPASLLRTLLRLRHDLVMIGRAADEPFPEVFRACLGPPLARVSETAADYLRSSSKALVARRPSPALDAVEAAFRRLRRHACRSSPRRTDPEFTW
jgi:hypothetical protein